MAINKPTIYRNTTTISTREGQVTNASFTNGMNYGASNACGIGIATGVLNPKESDWTLEDQHENARDPQISQYIGGNGLGDGDDSTGNISVVVTQETNVNDTAHYLEAVGAVAPGVEIVAGSGAINETGQAMVAGDRAWGVKVV